MILFAVGAGEPGLADADAVVAAGAVEPTTAAAVTYTHTSTLATPRHKSNATAQTHKCRNNAKILTVGLAGAPGGAVRVRAAPAQHHARTLQQTPLVAVAAHRQRRRFGGVRHLWRARYLHLTTETTKLLTVVIEITQNIEEWNQN